MKYRYFLFFVFLAGLVHFVHADIRMSGPVVTPTATPDPGKADVVDVYEFVNNRLKRTDTRQASYDLLVKAETEAYGIGWVCVRAEGSLDTGLQLNPGIVVEKVSFLIFFPPTATKSTPARLEPTSGCCGAAPTAVTAAAAASSTDKDIVPIPRNRGCGCAPTPEETP